MKKLLTPLLLFAALQTYAQAPENGIRTDRQSPVTSVKNQGSTGTCWCFSTTAMIESECLRKNLGEFDLSEMFTVRNIYLEKARNYVRRQGKAQFDEGGLGHDVISAMSKYGSMPESVYSGLKNGESGHNHGKLVKDLKSYLNETLKKAPIPVDWEAAFVKILDDKLGTPPASFEFQGKTYTPRSFADEVLQFRSDDYVNLTSFTHHPFHQSFIMEIPDNWANASYYNVPLEELVKAVDNSLSKGYTVMWDADISNSGFNQKNGYALETAEKTDQPDATEKVVNQSIRQQLFDTQVTVDDHLMQITGTGKSPAGKKFFTVKNSWGDTAGPFKGYIYVSEPYFAINTISVIVPKEAIKQ